MVNWLKSAVCKTVATGYVGSIPSSCTITLGYLDWRVLAETGIITGFTIITVMDYAGLKRWFESTYPNNLESNLRLVLRLGC